NVERELRAGQHPVRADRRCVRVHVPRAEGGREPRIAAVRAPVPRVRKALRRRLRGAHRRHEPCRAYCGQREGYETRRSHTLYLEMEDPFGDLIGAPPTPIARAIAGGTPPPGCPLGLPELHGWDDDEVKLVT